MSYKSATALLAAALFAAIPAAMFLNHLSSGEGNAWSSSTPQEDTTSTAPGLTLKDLKALQPDSVSALYAQAVLDHTPTEVYQTYFSDLDMEALPAQLSSDLQRMCFWINVYNAHTWERLAQDTSLYQEDRPAFFGKSALALGASTLSLEDVEHDILRRGATIWSTGLVRIPFRNQWSRNFQVEEVDPRIHFALNCGAASCPPFRVYLPSQIDDQLASATRAFLESEAQYDPAENQVSVPAFMLWFQGDFGMKKGVRAFLNAHGVAQVNPDTDVVKQPYDWTVDLTNAAE